MVQERLRRLGPGLLSAVSLLFFKTAQNDLGMWTETETMLDGRSFFSLTLLNDGRVLAAGGFGRTGQALNTAEVYDPVTGQWSATGKMRQATCYQSATLLPDGSVLVAAGTDDRPLKTAQLYNPATGKWTLTTPLYKARWRFSAVLVKGQVVVTGGEDQRGRFLRSWESYDPVAATWTTGTMNRPHFDHTQTLLNDDSILVAGGIKPPEIGTLTAPGPDQR